VWEARLPFGPGHRMYLAKAGQTILMLLLDGDKASQRSDIRRALAQDLRGPAFAREFLLAAIDDGVSVQQALGKVVRAMGVSEFAAKVRMASPDVLRAINPRHNPTQATLNRLLRPFGLRLSLAALEQPKRGRAA